jgi:feruloyl esterase
MIRPRTVLSAALLPCLFVWSAQARAANCESLAELALPDTTITLAQAVAAGAFAPAAPGNQAAAYADLPAFCRVAATVAPTADSAIKIEVWLPAADWNGKFQGVGNGGWTGSIATAALATALRRGYAVASTDTGHAGGSASFALGHPEKVLDFGYRAIHEMTVKGKALATAYYDAAAPERAYFVGCSAGGRQGMKAAQMYPQDYDGIVAGSPGLNWSGRALQTVWVGQAVARAPLPAAQFATLNAAAIAACDSLDGIADGVIDNPRQCNFDPAVLQCSAGETEACLTPEQVDTARSIYGGVRNSRTGATVVAGLSPGSETGWNTMAGAQPFGPGVDLFKYIVFGNADWDFRTLNWDADLTRTATASAALDALDTNLQPFFARGGKIVSYHGWADPQISPGSTVDYYDSVMAALGADTVQDAYRLFMVPGMAHCGGGTGTDQFDMLTALEQWVEQGQAPDAVPAARMVDGQTVRTRPLCPWPQSAVYDGSGSTDALENFSCR